MTAKNGVTGLRWLTGIAVSIVIFLLGVLYSDHSAQGEIRLLGADYTSHSTRITRLETQVPAIKEDISEIRREVERANTKLDRLLER